MLSNDDQWLRMFSRDELIAYFKQKLKIERLRRDVAIAEKDLYKMQNQALFKHLMLHLD